MTALIGESGARQRVRAWLAHGRRVLLVPQEPPLGPVAYTAPLVLTVATTALVALGLLGVTLHPAPALTPLLLAALADAALNYYAVPAVPGVPTWWSGAFFVHLTAAYAFGPAAVVACAVAGALAFSLRRRNGWFRVTFNVSKHVVSGSTAYAIFSHATAAPTTQSRVFLAGVAAAIAYVVVDGGLLTLVVGLAGGSGFSVRQWGQYVRALLPYAVAFGFGAAAVSLAESRVIVGVFLGFLVVVGSAQLSHVDRARRTFEHGQERERLWRRAAEADERARLQVALDIHDGVLQDLVGLSIEAELGAKRLLSGDAAGEELLQRTAALLKQSAQVARSTTNELRQLVFELAPKGLESGPALRTALEDLLRVRLGAQGVAIRVDVPDDLRITAEAGHRVYRACQEAARNASKYAEASSVTASVTLDDGVLRLSVTDDGVGFAPGAQDPRGGGQGLALHRLLIQPEGGTIDVSSAPGEGTTVTMLLPIASGNGP